MLKKESIVKVEKKQRVQLSESTGLCLLFTKSKKFADESFLKQAEINSIYYFIFQLEHKRNKLIAFLAELSKCEQLIQILYVNAPAFIHIMNVRGDFVYVCVTC